MNTPLKDQTYEPVLSLGNKREGLYFNLVLQSCIAERLLENERFSFSANYQQSN